MNDEENINAKLIENRINNFLGYGKIESDVWLIGKEEGFSGKEEDLEKRFIATKDKIILDIKEDMKDIPDHYNFFMEDNNKVQKTWDKLILILLKLEEKNETKLNYQKNFLARKNSNHCLLEFMPLPCKSTRKIDWLYEKFGIDYLKTRKEYNKKVIPKRIELFQKLITEYNKPKTIIFYSTNKKYIEFWKKISNCEFKKENDIYYDKKDNTNFFIIPHPTSWGNKDWEKIANRIKELSLYPKV